MRILPLLIFHHLKMDALLLSHHVENGTLAIVDEVVQIQRFSFYDQAALKSVTRMEPGVFRRDYSGRQLPLILHVAHPVRLPGEYKTESATICSLRSAKLVQK